MKLIDLDKLLPADIPPGERILWHGRPEWLSLARRAFRADFVAAWFAAATVWNVGAAAIDSGWGEAAISGAKTAGSGAAALALLGLLAWLSARTSLYVITSRRVVMKVGIALPIFFNLPFATIQSASLRAYSDGSGDIPLALGQGERIAYLHLWPHARPFRFSRPEPALRGLGNASEVAGILARALIALANEQRAQTAPAMRESVPRAEKAPNYPKGAVAAA